MSSKNGRSTHSAAWSLAARLTLWYTASAFGVVALVSGILYWALVTNLEREDDEELADKVRILREILSNPTTDMKLLRDQIELGWASRQHAQIYARVFEADGTILLETHGMSKILGPDLFPAPVSNDAQPIGMDVRTADGAAFRLLAASCSKPASRGSPVVVHVALDRTPEVDLIASYRVTTWIALATALVLCGIVGFQIARRGLRPLRDITATAAGIGASKLNERLNTDQLPAELATLALTFNEMLQRLEESFARLSRFSADIAHELRTPVNNLRGEVEVALAKPRTAEEYTDMLLSCLEESIRLSRLIDNLLFLARAEHPGTQIEKESLDLQRELTALQDFYDPKAAESGVELVVLVEQGCAARINRSLLQRAIGNLIENALKYTPGGGKVVLGAKQGAGSTLIEVSDTGIGIGEEHLPHLFDRFYRVDSARSAASGGIGLGLAIVKGIAELHGGSVAVASTPGHGTRITINFPNSSPRQTLEN